MATKYPKEHTLYIRVDPEFKEFERKRVVKFGMAT